MAENGLICPKCGKEWSQGRFCPDDGGELEPVVPPEPVVAATECFDAVELLELEGALSSATTAQPEPEAKPQSEAARVPEPASVASDAVTKVSPKKRASPKLQMEWPALRESRIQAALEEQKRAGKPAAQSKELAETAFQQAPPKGLASRSGRAPEYTHDDTSATVMETPAIRPAGSTSARMYANARQGDTAKKPDTVETVIDTPALSTEILLEANAGPAPADGEVGPEAPAAEGCALTEVALETSEVPAPEQGSQALEEEVSRNRPWWSRLMFWRAPDWSDFE